MVMWIEGTLDLIDDYDNDEDEIEEERPSAEARERLEAAAKSLEALVRLEHERARAVEDYKPGTPDDYESGTHGSTRRI
jgi:hypothetical protein